MSNAVTTSTPWSGRLSTARRPFYTWDDRDNPMVVDSAALTSSSELGNLTSPIAPAVNFNANGVFQPNLEDPPNTVVSLRWTSDYLKSHNLDNLGFTLHYEIETIALDKDTVGADGNRGTCIGCLVGGAASDNLGFLRVAGATSFSDFTGTLPVATTRINWSVGAEQITGPTHATVDMSFTKLATGYRLDVYLDHALWYTHTSTVLLNLDASNLLLNGSSGFFGPKNSEGRVRNALLISGPVDLSLGSGPVHCATIGDSNMAFMSYQGASEVPSNNPIVTGSGQATTSPPTTPAIAVALNTAGNVYLNSECCKKGIVPYFNDPTNGPTYGINNLSVSGATIAPRTDGGTGDLEGYVDSALALSTPPKYWFCNMGGNDLFQWRTYNNGYLLSQAAEWATFVVDTYVKQINRMLSGGVTNEVFICSPLRWYVDSSTPDFEDPTNLTQVFAGEEGAPNTVNNTNVLGSALFNEMDKRLPTLNPRVHYVNVYNEWDASLNCWPDSTPGWTSGLHPFYEGYRRQCVALGTIIPDAINRKPANSFRNSVYTKTVVSPYYTRTATTVPVYVETTSTLSLPDDVSPSFLNQPPAYTNRDKTQQRMVPVGVWPVGTTVTFNAANDNGDTKSTSIKLIQGTTASNTAQQQAALINANTTTSSFSAEVIGGFSEIPTYILYCSGLSGGMFHIASITIS